MTTAIEARERPILFSGAMVRAILEGKKTQTRRVVFTEQARRHDKAHRECWGADGYDVITASGEGLCRREWRPDLIKSWVVCPYGQPGDRLWVRETWNYADYDGALAPYSGYEYAASVAPGYVPEGGRWRPSIHMPRRASRLLLEVTDVRAERVQDISHEDARAEGVQDVDEASYYAIANFRRLWDSINGARPGGAWADNPWVWVVEFRRVRP